MSRFNHNLISTGMLSESLQDTLLTYLGVNPASPEPWPLTVYPRTLAVLAEVLLLKQQKEREAGSIKSQSEAAVISIWTRFLAAIKNAVVGFDNNVTDFDGKFVSAFYAH